jgi:hypothetical protein
VARESRDLEIDQDLEFQRREWRVQRVGWGVLTAFVLAATLGLFGGGPISSAQAGEPGAPLWVEYDRFIRTGAPTRIVVRGGMAPEGGLHLRMPRRYFEAFRIERMIPEPQAITIGDADVDLQFGREAGVANTFTLIFDVEPLRAGRHEAAFQANGNPAVTFAQFAYF